MANPESRGYIFAVWAGVRKVASADYRSIFYRACAKFATRFASKINLHGLSSNGASFAGIKKLRQLWCATQESRNALNRLRAGKKTVFFNIFVQISGQIWAVVGKGYFSHHSSHLENVASARRVEVALIVWGKKEHKHVHAQHSTVKHGSNPVNKPNILFLACPDAVLMNHLAFQCLMDLAKPNLLLSHKYLWRHHQEVLPNLTNGKFCNY